MNEDPGTGRNNFKSHLGVGGQSSCATVLPEKIQSRDRMLEKFPLHPHLHWHRIVVFYSSIDSRCDRPVQLGKPLIPIPANNAYGMGHVKGVRLQAPC